MNLSKVQLESIKMYGSIFYDWERIARNLGLDNEIFNIEMMNENSDARIAYDTGWDETNVKLVKSLVDTAINGSGQAQNLVIKIMDQTKIKNNLL